MSKGSRKASTQTSEGAGSEDSLQSGRGDRAFHSDRAGVRPKRSARSIWRPNVHLPCYVTGPPGDPSRVFVVEGGGTIRLVKDGVTQPTPFLTIPEVYTGCNDCGLFSMAFAPDYATSGRFYVFYTRDSTGHRRQYYLRIEEFRRSAADPDVADPASRRIVLEIPQPSERTHDPQRRPAPVRTRRAALYLRRRRRPAGGPERQRPEHRRPCTARSCESIRPGRCRVSTRSPPTIRSRVPPRRGRDLFLRAPQPLAVLFRSPHGRPDDRRRGQRHLEEVDFMPIGAPGAAPISAGTASRATRPSPGAARTAHLAEPDAPGARYAHPAPGAPR